MKYYLLSKNNKLNESKEYFYEIVDVKNVKQKF